MKQFLLLCAALMFGMISVQPSMAQVFETVEAEGSWSYDNIVPEVKTIHDYFLMTPGLGTYEERVVERNKRVRALFLAAFNKHVDALSRHRKRGSLILTVNHPGGYRSKSGFLDFGPTYELFDFTFAGNGLKGQLVTNQPGRVGFSVGGQHVSGTVGATAKYTQEYIISTTQAARDQARLKCRNQNLPEDTTPDPT